MFNRLITLELPTGQSAFLWGARQTGKSYFLHYQFPTAVYYDLLDSHELIKFEKEPYLLREEILSLEQNNKLIEPVIIDEIQKVPSLLNEVHWLIENKKIKFILCGSSSKKLKSSATNLLGGRAWQFNFYPLSYAEINNFDLLRALQHGLIPKHYLADPKYINENLRAYVEVYLTEEIRNEGLVRNLAGFARFLDVAGMCNAEMLNFNNIARDCGIERHTVQEYYQILLDTWLGYYIYPYKNKIKRDIIIAAPKFYLFDVGVANYLAKSSVIELTGNNAGKSFEHYILLELIAYRGIKRKRFDITYWRTKTGLEVDFILSTIEPKYALEIKISRNIHKQDLKGLLAFCEENPMVKPIVIALVPKARLLQIDAKTTIQILPYNDFLSMLWEDKIDL